MSDATVKAAGGGGDPSLFRRMLDRRVPHVLGGYVAALAGVGGAAAAHLDRALDVWAAADPGYEPAAEARELRATIEGG